MEIKENERNALIEEHDYDGIKELDNKPPPWIMWLFYITIFWAVMYLVVFHVLKIGKLQDQEYVEEVNKATILQQQLAATKTFDETNVVLLTDDASLSLGKEMFTAKTCVTCHGSQGEGNAIGPNLTDEYWISGNTPNDVFKTIKYGNAIKGMTPFKDQLNDEKIQQLVSYVLVSLKGSNPPNAKAPQGEKY